MSGERVDKGRVLMSFATLVDELRAAGLNDEEFYSECLGFMIGLAHGAGVGCAGLQQHVREGWPHVLAVLKSQQEGGAS